MIWYSDNGKLLYYYHIIISQHFMIKILWSKDNDREKLIETNQ